MSSFIGATITAHVHADRTFRPQAHEAPNGAISITLARDGPYVNLGLYGHPSDVRALLAEALEQVEQVEDRRTREGVPA